MGNLIEHLKNENNHEYSKLKTYAKKLHKTFENECNGCIREKFSFESWETYDKDREWQMLENEMQQKTYLMRIRSYCEMLGLHYYIQPDPRGCTLYVSKDNVLTDQNYHTMGEVVA